MAPTKHSNNERQDPTQETIHGISLSEYASMSYYLAGETEPDLLFAQKGIDRRIWNEVDRSWRKRMEEDESFILITRYSQYYNEADKYLNK